MKTWFKFYGQEFLTDPKMLSLTALERSLWVTVLCLASSSDDEGVIKHIDEHKIKLLTNLSPLDDEWNIADGFLQKFQELEMITLDNKMITLQNFNKRQDSNLTGYERVKRFRENHKDEAKINDTNDNVINDNVRIEKNREEKNREEEREKKYPLTYLSDIPENDLKEFTTKFSCNTTQVKNKAQAVIDYCKSKNKRYTDYKAALRQWLRKDFGERPVITSQVHEVPEEISEEQRMKNMQRIAEIKSNFKYRN